MDHIRRQTTYVIAIKCQWLNLSNVDTVVQGQSKVEQTLVCLSSL